MRKGGIKSRPTIKTISWKLFLKLLTLFCSRSLPRSHFNINQKSYQSLRVFPDSAEFHAENPSHVFRDEKTNVDAKCERDSWEHQHFLSNKSFHGWNSLYLLLMLLNQSINEYYALFYRFFWLTEIAGERWECVEHWTDWRKSKFIHTHSRLSLFLFLYLYTCI